MTWLLILACVAAPNVPTRLLKENSCRLKDRFAELCLVLHTWSNNGHLSNLSCLMNSLLMKTPAVMTMNMNGAARPCRTSSCLTDKATSREAADLHQILWTRQNNWRAWSPCRPRAPVFSLASRIIYCRRAGSSKAENIKLAILQKISTSLKSFQLKLNSSPARREDLLHIFSIRLLPVAE